MTDDPRVFGVRAQEDRMWRWIEDHAEALNRVVHGAPERAEDRHVAKVAAGLVQLELLHRQVRHLAAPSPKEDSGS